MEEEWLNTDQVAELLGCSRAVVQQRISRNELSAIKINRRLHVELREVARWKRWNPSGRSRRPVIKRRCGQPEPKSTSRDWVDHPCKCNIAI